RDGGLVSRQPDLVEPDSLRRVFEVVRKELFAPAGEMIVVVFGAGGLLGRHVVEELRGHEARALDRHACDVGDLDQVTAAARGAALLINCAGFTNVDGAERDEAGAYRANAIGAENVARAALAEGAK